MVVEKMEERPRSTSHKEVPSPKFGVKIESRANKVTASNQAKSHRVATKNQVSQVMNNLAFFDC